MGPLAAAGYVSVVSNAVLAIVVALRFSWRSRLT